MPLSKKSQDRLGLLAGLALVVAPFICADIATTQRHSRRVVEDHQGLTVNVSKLDNKTQSVSYGIISCREVLDSNGDGFPDYTIHMFGTPRRGYSATKVSVTEKDQEMFTFGISQYEKGRPLGIANTIKWAFQNGLQAQP